MRPALVLGVLCAVFVVAPTTEAGFAGTDVYVASVGHGSGSGGSEWKTTIWIYNPGPGAANCQVYFLFRDQANPSPPVYNVTVAEGDTVRFDDAVWRLFGITGFGAIRVTSNAPVIVNSRIYNQVGADISNTQGQFFGAVPASFAIGSGESTQVLGINQGSDGDFRFNYGFVETTGNQVTLELSLYDGDGAVLAVRGYTLQGRQALQVGVADMGAGSTPTTNGRLQVAVTGGSGRVVAFGSGIANGSTDPSTFEMSYSDDLLAGGATSGITGVTAGDGLSGGGSTGNVTLAVGAGTGIRVSSTDVNIDTGGVGSNELAAGAVTKAKLSASGGSNGQVLGTDGSNLVWTTPSSGGTGDITAVSAGSGLLGGGTSGSVTLSLNTSVVRSEAISALAPTTNSLDSRIDALENETIVTVIASDTVSPDQHDCAVAYCPSSHPVAIGGGTDLDNVLTMRVTANAPRFGGSRTVQLSDGNHGAPNGWQGCAVNLGTTSKTIKVAVICSK